MKNPITTIIATIIAVFQALVLVPALVKYQWLFQGLAIVLTPIWGYYQADAKKGV
jgi:hypothetical protein